MALSEWIRHDTRLVVLTGAGISVASGIPPYRDHGGNWLGSQPIQHQEFIEQSAKRQRYWARSAVGWPAVAQAEPNNAHYALAVLERANIVSLLVTQNVDRLHQRAGHQNVVDLHGRLDRVTCLSCGLEVERTVLQQELLVANPFLAEMRAEVAPDGDANVVEQLVNDVIEPVCQICKGILKPDVVFFGGAVPRERVERVSRAIESCDVLLVAGSSLMVYSGFRFCRLAQQLGKPVIAINQGATRADDLLVLKIQEDCASTLGQLARQLGLQS